jgi:hypothetical protein
MEQEEIIAHCARQRNLGAGPCGSNEHSANATAAAIAQIVRALGMACDDNLAHGLVNALS